MSDKILSALQKLDAKNDNHWTQDGSPRIDTVRLLAGDQTISREQVLAAAPQFSRQNLATAPELPAGSPNQAPDSTSEAPGAGASSTVATGETKPEGEIPILGVNATTEDVRGEEGVDYHAGVDANSRPTGVILEGLEPNHPPAQVDILREQAENGEFDADQLQEEIAQLEKTVSDKQDALAKAREDLEVAQNKLAFATDEGRETNPNAIPEYLAAQKKRAQERGEARKQLNELGVDYKKLAADASPSPLDQSLAARNKARRNTNPGGQT